MKIKIAPKPAPAEIPSSPGSARLFLNRDCKTIPEHDREAPTIMAFKTLGSLISKIIFLWISFSDEKIFITSINDIVELPNEIETTTEIINTIVRASKIKYLFDNYPN